MNLNQAFKKRNKLQEEINTLKGMMSSKIVIKEAKEPENTRLLNGLTCEKWFTLTNDKIAEMDPENKEDWFVEKKESDPKIINIP